MSGRYWWKNAKIYELYVDKFAGNFASLAAQLDYFEKLGVNALHILPHYPSPMVDGGYDVMDYLNVRPELGTLDDFDEFVKQAHKRDIRIIVDFVLNHVSEFHPWFLEARTAKDSLKHDWFLWSETGKEFASAWNAPSGFKESNWIRNDPTGDYYYATFYPQQPDLNWDNPHVVDAMLANMDFWVDHGVDGFRLDAALTLIKRESGSRGLPETHAILKHIRRHLDTRFGGRIALLAESHMKVEEIKSFFGDGDECHMAYHFPLMEAMLLALTRYDRTPVDDILKRSEGIPENCTWACFLRNHDEISLATLPENERRELIGQLDPMGTYFFNGGTIAMRLGSIFENDRARILQAFELLYSVPYATVMYYGDEIGMRNVPREEGITDTRVYVRGEFDWEEAEKQIADSDSLFQKTKAIIQKSYWPWELGKPETGGVFTEPRPTSESRDDAAPSHL